MAHPHREAMVGKLVATLDRPAKVIWDRRNDRHDTGIRAMQAFDPSCTHHLVIQDDVVASRDLVAGAERALESVPPESPVSLYLGRVRPFRRAVDTAVARAGDVSWLTMAGIYWGPAIILPTDLIDQMAAWYLQSKVTNYDARMSKWFERRRIGCWYSWPSLVDHQGDQSLVNGRKARRTAHRFIGAECSALSVDWSRGVYEVPNSRGLDRSRQRAARAAGGRR